MDGSRQSAATPTTAAHGVGVADAPLRVLVVLPRNLDVAQWAARFARGEVPDETPYGYHFARRAGCEVTFARPTPAWPGPAGLFDKAFKKILGFDLRHIWANRDLIADRRFDCIWTHTEYEHLAIGLFRQLRKRAVATPLIAQSVWLVDEWPRWSGLRRAFYRRLMRDSHVASFLSPLNADRARTLKLGRRVEVVEFGISLDSFPSLPESGPPGERPPARPVRVLALGNDRHRDWTTLAGALGGRPGYEVRIGSGTFPAHLRQGNIQAGPMSQREVIDNYAWADCVAVPLVANQHASGVTAMLEAMAMNVPVIAARAGGLPFYFGDDCVAYHDIGDADGLRRSLDHLMREPGARLAQVRAARKNLMDRQLTSEGFALRHVRLSRELARAGHGASQGVKQA